MRPPLPAPPRRRSSLGRTLRRSSKGQSLVEMGLLLPLVLVIIIGVVEVADTLNGYVTIVNAARDGARLGSKNLASDTQIQNLVLVETERLRDPVNASDVTVTHLTFDGVPAIRVQVCNDRTLILDVPLIMPETFRMCSSTTMRVLPGSGTGAPPNSTNTPSGPTPTNTSAAPTPTNTPAPPTPTNTPVPPTPTNTPVPPTPTFTPVPPTPTNTPVPPTPTNTPVPPTNTPVPPTPTNTSPAPTATPTTPWWCAWFPWLC